MNAKRLSSTLALLGLLTSSTASFAQTVDVQQYWTSSSESKAMNAIADAYKARGGKWIDSPSADFNSAIAAATSRIAGGEPPSAVLMTPSGAMRDLATAGQLRDFTDMAEAGGWQKVMAPLIWDKLNVDGKLVGLPVGIHADNWIWYSKPLFEKAGIAEPKTLDEMFAAADKLKEAGHIPFAVGGEPWQEVTILTGFILALGGPDYWDQLFIKRDPEAVKSPILPKAFELFRKVSTYADPASPGRSWNDTTNLVVTGKAGMQFMGDWARGEFLAGGAGCRQGLRLLPDAERQAGLRRHRRYLRLPRQHRRGPHQGPEPACRDGDGPGGRSQDRSSQGLGTLAPRRRHQHAGCLRRQGRGDARQDRSCGFRHL